MLIPRDVLRELRGFDEQFFYYYEDMDLCRRIWKLGRPIVYTPEASITHLKGQSTNQRLPSIVFALDRQITRYLYYYKYNGRRGVWHARRIALVSLFLRRAGYLMGNVIRPTEGRRRRLELLRILLHWNYRVDPVRLVENGEEPYLDGAVAGRVLER
jgi:hypothetical protein